MRKIMKDLESSPKGKFSEIAHSYSQLSSLQQSADQVLIKKLKIREDEDILDLGCGLGQLTAEIRKITKGSIFGVDPAVDMIQKAKQTYASQKIQFFVQSAEDYKTLFEKEGFEVESAEILFVTSRKNPDQVMDSFESGATLAYCNPDCYRESITQEKSNDFRNIVRKNFNDMADDSGAMELLFNRIELVAKKP